MNKVEPFRARVVNIPNLDGEVEEETVKGMSPREKAFVYCLSFVLIAAVIFVLQKLFGG